MFAVAPSFLAAYRVLPLPVGNYALDVSDLRGANAGIAVLDEAALEVVVAEGKFCVRSRDGSITIPVTEADDLPSPPDLRSVTWQDVGAGDRKSLLRLAKVCPTEKEDRPGFRYVWLRYGTAEATDEVVFARTKIHPTLCGALPAGVFAALPTGVNAQIGETGSGALALRSHDWEFTAWIYPAPEPPALGGVFRTGPGAERSVSRADLKRAITQVCSAANKAPVVRLTFKLDRIVASVDQSWLSVPAAGDCEGEIYVSAAALAKKAVATGSKAVRVIYRGAMAPLEVLDDQFRTLIYPLESVENVDPE